MCHLDLSKLKLIASCDGCQALRRGPLTQSPQHLVVLLPGLISQPSTQNIDFVKI